MGLLDQIREESDRGPTRSECTIARIYAEMQKPDADELHDAMADHGISSAVIARVLKARGVNVQSQTVRRHRRGECSCERV